MDVAGVPNKAAFLLPIGIFLQYLWIGASALFVLFLKPLLVYGGSFRRNAYNTCLVLAFCVSIFRYLILFFVCPTSSCLWKVAAAQLSRVFCPPQTSQFPHSVACQYVYGFSLQTQRRLLLFFRKPDGSGISGLRSSREKS